MITSRQREAELYRLFQAIGIETVVGSADTNGTPTDTALKAEFGDADTLEDGWLGVYVDTDTGSGGVFLVTAYDGDFYYVAKMTKAT